MTTTEKQRWLWVYSLLLLYFGLTILQKWSNAVCYIWTEAHLAQVEEAHDKAMHQYDVPDSSPALKVQPN